MPLTERARAFCYRNDRALVVFGIFILVAATWILWAQIIWPDLRVEIAHGMVHLNKILAPYGVQVRVP